MSKISTTKRAREVGTFYVHISEREQGVCFAYMKGGIDEVGNAA